MPTGWVMTRYYGPRGEDLPGSPWRSSDNSWDPRCVRCGRPMPEGDGATLCYDLFVEKACG